MDPNLLRESENVEDRRTDEPSAPDWLTQQERPDLPPGVIGSDAYWRRRKREGLIRSGYTSLDPQQLQYQIYATHGTQPLNPYNALVGASPQQRPFPIGQPQSFYDRLQQVYGAQPGPRPSDLREFRAEGETFREGGAVADPYTGDDPRILRDVYQGEYIGPRRPAPRHESPSADPLAGDVPSGPLPHTGIEGFAPTEAAAYPFANDVVVGPVAGEAIPFEPGASSDQPFTIHSPTKITLSPTAQRQAREYGMTLAEFGKYLLQREKMRNAGLTD
jgi:hypothetical protein